MKRKNKINYNNFHAPSWSSMEELEGEKKRKVVFSTIVENGKPITVETHTVNNRIQSALKQDQAREKRQQTAIANAEQAPRLPKGSPEGEEAFRKARNSTHMRPIPAAPEKPVLSAPLPVRIAAARQETPNKAIQQIEKFFALREKLEKKL